MSGIRGHDKRSGSTVVATAPLVIEIVIGDRCGAGAAETNDGLTMIVAGRPLAEYESKVFGAATPTSSASRTGPGWTLVGDAGYLEDPITAQGMSDAFRDAELLAAAIEAWRSGASSCDDAMARYQSTRDAASLPMFELTCQVASLEPPPSELFAEANVARIFAAASLV